MHTYRVSGDKFQVGYYAPVTWVNPIFGARTVDEWKTVKEVLGEDEAQSLVAKLNGSCISPKM